VIDISENFITSIRTIVGKLISPTTPDEQKNDPKKHLLIQKIDQWRKDSINKIQQTA
jgi:hypothetical protein